MAAWVGKEEDGLAEKERQSEGKEEMTGGEYKSM